METYSNSSSIRVLHVEDNLAYARLVKESIKDFSTSKILLWHCTKLEDAYTLLEKERMDVVLLDLSLPDSLGLNSVETLHNRFPEVALIVLTGTRHEELGIQALQLGAQDYLVKDNCGGDMLVKSIFYACERQRIDTKIRDQALTDGLTGLPNRAHFMGYLKNALSRASRLHSNITLLYLDFDGFKQINDTFGHLEGDMFLIEAANRIKSCIRQSDFCARLGGDEFAIVADASEFDFEFSIPLADKVLSSMRETFYTRGGIELSVSCSVGAAIYQGRNNHTTIDRFIQSADEAMYRAKYDGGDCYCLYDEHFAKESLRSSKMLIQLRSALKKTQFHLEFQPIINTQTGVISAVETLLRWTDNEGNIVPPTEFIPYLEKNQMIRTVGEWVLKEACTQFKAQFGNLKRIPQLTINVSPLQLKDPTFIRCVAECLDEADFDSSWLVLEITENVLLNDIEQMMSALNELVDMGILIAIDDFGTGYSSMKYLMDIPAEILKIDRTFVEDLSSNKSHQLITKGMIRLAHALGKSVVVEGVETKDVARALTLMGADFLQGFYFSHPVSLDGLKENLAVNHAVG